MRNLNDYRTAIYFQLISYQDPNDYSIYIKIARSWDDLAKTIHKRYRSLMKVDKAVKKTVQRIAPDGLDPQERMARLYQFVRDSIDLEDYKGLFARDLQKASKVLKNRRGSAIEKNLTLIALLRAADISANPLLIRTRKNGQLIRNFPSLTQFNHVMTFVEIDGENHFLDPKNKFCPIRLLPVSDLVESGLLVTGKTGRIIPIKHPDTQNSRTLMTKVQMHADGSIRCTVDLVYSNYLAYQKRLDLYEQTFEEDIKALLTKRFQDVELDSFSVKYYENAEERLKLYLEFSVPEYGYMVGDMLTFPLPAMSTLLENPFTRETRLFPVEFGYPFRVQETLIIQFPESYQLEEAPAAGAQMKEGKYMYRMMVKADSTSLMVLRGFEISKSTFSPKEYKDIRNFYAYVVQHDLNEIVLKARKPLFSDQ